MPHLDRRRLLALGGASIALGGLRQALPFGPRPGGTAPGRKKLLFIELSGGNDALSTLLPLGDAQYGDPALRPTLWVPEKLALDLGNGFAGLNPKMPHTRDLVAAGDVALVHRVAYDNPNLSHFAGGRAISTAVPGDESVREGVIHRWGAAAFPGEDTAFVSVTKHPLGIFQGSTATPHILAVDDFLFGSDPESAKLRDALIASYGEAAGLAGDRSDYVASMGDVTFATLGLAEQLPPTEPDPETFPQTPGELALQGLDASKDTVETIQSLRDALRLLKQTDVRVAGVRVFGWDSHGDQGGLEGGHARLVRLLDHCLHATRLDTADDLWDDLVVLVLSEFGRTTRENGSGGTDHGVGGLAFVAGGAVNGGVYHCDPTSWPSGETLLSHEDKYLAHLTDYRALYAEILDRHFGSDAALLDVALPGWSQLVGTSSKFDYVGFL